jgi:hypothetical protein
MREDTDVLETAMRLLTIGDPLLPLALRTATALGVFDALRPPKASTDRVGTTIGALPRLIAGLLHALAGMGLVEADLDGDFQANSLGDGLDSTHPLSMRDGIPLIPADLAAWTLATHSFLTGEAAFPLVHGEGYWEHLTAHPSVSAQVDRSVRASNRILVRALARIYPWGRFSRIVDVGSGDGSFMAGLLERFPGIEVVLQDRPHVLALANHELSQSFCGRFTLAPGDFRSGVPEGGNAYVLKTILHDWDDKTAHAILGHIRHVIPPDGRLMLIEALLTGDNRFDIGKLLDLHSLVLVGGVNRSLDELTTILALAGFRVLSTYGTGHALTLIEATPGGTEGKRL